MEYMDLMYLDIVSHFLNLFFSYFREKIENYYNQLNVMANRREELAKWKLRRADLKEKRINFNDTFEWLPKTSEAPIQVCDEVSSAKEMPLISPSSSNYDFKTKVSRPVDFNKADGSPVDLREVNDDLELISPCTAITDEMTASQMSTSSDYMMTPLEERVADFDNFDSDVGKNEKNHNKIKINDGYKMSTIKEVIHSDLGYSDTDFNTNDNYTKRIKNMPDNYSRNLEIYNEQYISNLNSDLQNNKKKMTQSQLTLDGQSWTGKDDPNLPTGRSVIGDFALEIKQKVLEEEFDVKIARTTINSNLNEIKQSTVTQEVQKPSSSDDSLNDNGNIDLENQNDNIKSDHDTPNDDNGNEVTSESSFNTLVSEYIDCQETAVANKKKVQMIEYSESSRSSSDNKTVKSLPLQSLEAHQNKQKVLELEYGVYKSIDSAQSTPLDSQDSGFPIYRRQSSNRSNSTACSSMFATPEETDKPILIDQVN